MKKSIYILVILMAAGTLSAQAKLSIYLPVQKTCDTDRPELRHAALILGDEAMVQAAGQVKLGQFSTAGQELLIDRQTILSCLAGAGIAAGQVQFSGAPMIRLGRNEKTIEADRFLETARLFLDTQLDNPKPVSIRLLRPAQDYVLPNLLMDIELKPRLAGQPSRGVYKVIVGILQQGIEIDHRELSFAAQYEGRRTVAVRRLEAGTEVTPENTRIETYTASSPQVGEVFVPYGMVTCKIIEAERPLEPGNVESATPPVMVKKQQQVILKIETNLMHISAYGEAMEDGKPGDLIRVRRGSRATGDERYVIGKVMPDGTVQPAVM